MSREISVEVNLLLLLLHADSNKSSKVRPTFRCPCIKFRIDELSRNFCQFVAIKCKI